MKYRLEILADNDAEMADLMRRFLGGTPSQFTSAPVSLPQFTAAPVPPSEDDEGDTSGGPGGVDSSGRPYDKNIHSDKGGKNKDGTWRLRRNLNPTVLAAADAAWQAMQGAQGMPIPSAPMQAPTPAQQWQPPMPPAGQQWQPPTPPAQPPQQWSPPPGMMPPPTAAAPQPFQPPSVAPVALPPTPATGLDFNGLMQHIATKTQQVGPNGQPLIDVAYLQSLAQRLQLPNNDITVLMNQPQLIPVVASMMQADGKW